jgi:hypothetical protein
VIQIASNPDIKSKWVILIWSTFLLLLASNQIFLTNAGGLDTIKAILLIAYSIFLISVCAIYYRPSLFRRTLYFGYIMVVIQMTFDLLVIHQKFGISLLNFVTTAFASVILAFPLYWSLNRIRF